MTRPMRRVLRVISRVFILVGLLLIAIGLMVPSKADAPSHPRNERIGL